MPMSLIQQQILDMQNSPNAPKGIFRTIQHTHGIESGLPRNSNIGYLTGRKLSKYGFKNRSLIQEGLDYGRAFTGAIGDTVASRFARFAPSPGARLVWNMNKASIKMNAKVLSAGARGAAKIANGASHALLGASLGQVGAAAGLVGLAAYGIGSALGISREQASNAASVAGEFIKGHHERNYGSSQLGQSTQGLVFGLHSRRTA